MKILVCDDDRSIVRLCQISLERQGHEVVTAFGGHEALAKIASEAPDFVILDLMMPDLDGLEVLKIMRNDPQAENLPVVIISAKTQDKDISEAYSLGADMYLTKPFNPRELVSFGQR